MRTRLLVQSLDGAERVDLGSVADTPTSASWW